MDQVRGRADEWMRELAREGRGSTPGVGHLIVEVIDGGSKPTSAPGRNLARVLTVTGDEAENAVAGFTALDDREVVVTVLGGVPAVGERLVASHSAGRWFARRKGTSPPVGDRILCGTARVCGTGSAGLAGATFSVTGSGAYSASCTTVAGSGQCCITLPGDGTYTATMNHGTHGSQTRTVTVSGPGTTNAIFCLGSSGGPEGGLLCLEVSDCGRPTGLVGETIEFVQGGTVVATGVVDSNGRVCACLPARADTTVRLASGGLPARYLPAELFVPVALVPGLCGKAELWSGTVLPICGPSGNQACRLALQPAPGYACWPCLDIGCDLPIADTLHATDPATGRAITLTRSGVLAWLGSDTATSPGCGSFLSPTACPVASVPLLYRLGVPSSGATNPRCLFSVSARWHFEKVVYGPGPFDYVMAQCPGEGTDPDVQELFPDFWKSVTVPVNVIACPPGFTAVTALAFKHPFECDQGAATTVTITITE